MSIDCEGYQPSSQFPDHFDIKYRIGKDVVWVRVSREAIEDFCCISGGVLKKFEESSDQICGQVGVWLARMEASGQRTSDRYLIGTSEFPQVMAEVAQ